MCDTFKVGDTVFISDSDSEGWFPVKASDGQDGTHYPLEVNDVSYTEEGRILVSAKYPSLHRTDFTGKGPSEREIDWSKVPTYEEVIGFTEKRATYLGALGSYFYYIYENEREPSYCGIAPTFPDSFIIPDAWYET